MPIEILMPALSPTMSKTGGKIVKWCKKEQEKIKVGDIIAEIETDKAIMEFESSNDGVLAKILVPDGTSGIPINQPIALILEDGEDSSILDMYSTSSVEAKKKEISEMKSLREENRLVLVTEQQSSIGDVNKVKISPLAKKIAINEDIDISLLRGTGPYGRIIKADILDFLERNTQTKKRFMNKDIIVKASSMRYTIAKRLVESKQTIPHFYLTIDCNVTDLMLLRTQINLIDKNHKVTVNDLIIKAIALALSKFPDINSSWKDNEIIKYANIDISFAVALEDGLITPIVKNADKKSIRSISKEVKDLILRAKLGKLKLEEFQGQGGGLTISNLGMYNIKAFSAIINPPQSCIVAVGASEKRPIVFKEKIEIAEIMTVVFSIDHRIVDGVLAAKFLNSFKHYIENPLIILLE